MQSLPSEKASQQRQCPIAVVRRSTARIGLLRGQAPGRCGTLAQRDVALVELTDRIIVLFVAPVGRKDTLASETQHDRWTAEDPFAQQESDDREH